MFEIGILQIMLEIGIWDFRYGFTLHLKMGLLGITLNLKLGLRDCAPFEIGITGLGTPPYMALAV